MAITGRLANLRIRLGSRSQVRATQPTPPSQLLMIWLFRNLREQTHTDALLFMREQRIKCLLKGTWFPIISTSTSPSDMPVTAAESQKLRVTAWRFVSLSNDRKFLHHASHNSKLDKPPHLHELSERLDLETISSVDSSVARSDVLVDDESKSNGKHASTGTITRLTIFGNANTFAKTQTPGESVLLELNTGSASLASEWLDGLLMLLNQQPITADTNKYVGLLEQWSLTIRMLNLRWEDVDWERAQDNKQLPVPSRAGLDDDFWYDM
jgi:engulfment/cell motility protein 1